VRILNLVLVRSSVILTVLVAAVAIASPAQTFTKLADLVRPDHWRGTAKSPHPRLGR